MSNVSGHSIRGVVVTVRCVFGFFKVRLQSAFGFQSALKFLYFLENRNFGIGTSKRFRKRALPKMQRELRTYSSLFTSHLYLRVACIYIHEKNGIVRVYA